MKYILLLALSYLMILSSVQAMGEEKKNEHPQPPQPNLTLGARIKQQIREEREVYNNREHQNVLDQQNVQPPPQVLTKKEDDVHKKDAHDLTFKEEEGDKN